ncbi:MAG: L-seryl-tRNA(Sec) selenium transferase [Myxococcales bacterium]|nr:L-seryl-tRNA(Sec) selenium transferase [Myxococcales bacterium]
MSELLASLPRVDRVLAHPALDEARARVGPALKALVREVIEEARASVRGGGTPIDADEAARRVATRASAWSARRMARVINATGVILHTNLGRAPLSRAAVDALGDQGGGYVSLEIDLESGRRGGRASHAENALATLTGAEAALVVNNNAAAVVLALAALALGRSVVVSRGELVEIGGGFRVPEVLARSGAKLVEVGTTNRTRTSDYARALDEVADVAAILRVHPGNFRQSGFVERPSLAELVSLGRGRNVAVIEDLGGGSLVDLASFGLGADPLVSSSVAAGVDLATFSTDKILGGPQGGVVLGKRAAVERARRDPLARALRMGRLPLAALEATLAAHLSGEVDEIPALRMARRPAHEVHARARRWAARLGLSEDSILRVTAVAGGGTYAGDELPSWALSVRPRDPDAFAAALRRGKPAVVARIAEGAVLFDARTVMDDEDDALVVAIDAAIRAT